MKSKKEISEMPPNQLVSWFMMASYAYYIEGTSVMSDYDFDYLVERLKENWTQIDHPHKKHITESHLDAGTGYDIHYPMMVKFATLHYLREQNECR
ncbi:MAG: hypothetical protein CBC29_06215 [Methylococcaceae bacterium TMED69]|nr:MAG: hypothetical protein CBC29_06215 [Methylococcaceae bacterium TMED69]|tara:strand:+ start:1057 stop:1344 length:288 start_codon:yes stop_codon:yes gene_type:complete